MRWLPALLCLAALSVAPAAAQSKARIFDLAIGTPVADLPLMDWVEPRCGTNGGPPSTALAGFDDFARCRPEAATGLHEVWFIYDDEWEYIARAYRDPMEILSYTANVFFSQPIITSLLIDDAGLVQGYRVVTDPRAPVDVRRQAFAVHAMFKSLYNEAPWRCLDEPLAERELPVEAQFLKASCVMVSDSLFARSEGRLLQRPGMELRDLPGMAKENEGNFESQARLEVLAREVAAVAPCCAAAVAGGSPVRVP